MSRSLSHGETQLRRAPAQTSYVLPGPNRMPSSEALSVALPATSLRQLQHDVTSRSLPQSPGDLARWLIHNMHRPRASIDVSDAQGEWVSNDSLMRVLDPMDELRVAGETCGMSMWGQGRCVWTKLTRLPPGA